MKKRIFFIVLISIVICSIAIESICANTVYEDISKFKAIEVTQEELDKIETHDKIKATDDLSIPEEPLSSIDVNSKGELLICFTSKIMVFNEAFEPIRAYLIDWGKGRIPFAVWNEKSNNIIYMRGDGYEFNNNGLIIIRYDISNTGEYRLTSVKKGNKTYELQNRICLPNLSSKDQQTYSSLVLINESGEEIVLYESLQEQLLIQIIHYILIFGAIAAVISIFIRESRKKKLHKLRYGNIKEDELYKRVYVKEKPKIVLSKDSLGRKTQHL